MLACFVYKLYCTTPRTYDMEIVLKTLHPCVLLTLTRVFFSVEWPQQRKLSTYHKSGTFWKSWLHSRLFSSTFVRSEFVLLPSGWDIETICADD
jgi:hypothetical protein